MEWDNYDYEKAAVDAILIQTSSTKLRQKALQENPTWNQLVDMGMGQEQAQRKAQSMPDPEENQIKALQEKVRKLEMEKANRGRRPDRPASRERKTSCRYCAWYRCKDPERCPAKEKECNNCGIKGHFAKSEVYKKKKGGPEKVARVDDS